MADGPVRIGLEDIKAGFKLHKKSPYFALFETTGGRNYGAGNLIYSYTGGDRDGEGWDELQENLAVADSSAPMTCFILRFYDDLDKKGTITSGTPHSGSFKLRMQDLQGMMPAGKGAAAVGGNIMNDLFQAKLDLFDLKWQHRMEDQERRHQAEKEELQAALDAAEAVEEEAEEADEIGSVMRTIGAVGEQYPWLQETVNKLGTGIADLLSYGGIKARRFMNNNTNHAAMNGVHTEAPPAGDYTTDRYSADMNAHLGVLRDFFVRTYGSMATPEGKLQGLQEMSRCFETLAHLAQQDPDKLEFAILKLHKERG